VWDKLAWMRVLRVLLPPGADRQSSPEFGCRMQHGSRSRSLVSAHELGRASPGGGCYRIIRQYSVEQMAWVSENKPRFLRQS
jgi:hypothetical protein